MSDPETFHRRVRVAGSASPLLALLLLAAVPTSATEYLHDPDTDPHIPALVRDVFVADGAGLDPAIAQADIEFARNMARHHQGAVDMARLYLDDPRGRNPVIRRLAQSIIANQQFEIAVLESVRRRVEAGPRVIAASDERRLVALDRGIDGLEHVWRFNKAPPPSMVDILLTPDDGTSDFDVQFARPMIRHHRAAIEMAEKYDTTAPHVNRIVFGLNRQIKIDQAYEIALMQRLLDRYPREVAAVPDDPEMMAAMKRSMGDMMH